jgi:hypothetical protein
MIYTIRTEAYFLNKTRRKKLERKLALHIQNGLCSIMYLYQVSFRYLNFYSGLLDYYFFLSRHNFPRIMK